MKASLSTNAVANDLTLPLQGLNWEDTPQASFYEGELQGRDLLKLSGQEWTGHLWRRQAGAAPTLEVGGETSTGTAAAPGPYQTL